MLFESEVREFVVFENIPLQVESVDLTMVRLQNGLPRFDSRL